MTDIRELLELAARAMEYTVHEGRHHSITVPALWISPNDSPLKFSWSPNHDSADAADMCAALTIGTDWTERRVICVHREIYRNEKFADHNNDRSAAWRLAALRVAAEIGKGMQ